jgi:hypothetical protein
MANRSAEKGFTWPGITVVEWAFVGCLLFIVLAFAFVSFGNGGESSDASVVQSAQEALQAIISQGALRMDTRPDQLTPSAVLIAVQSAMEEGAPTTHASMAGKTAPPPHSNPKVRFNNVGNQYVMTIDHSHRSATFTVASNGDVRLVGLNNFPNYRVDGTTGSITRSP